MKIYIVVPTYDRIDKINNLIKQLEAQTYQDFKLVVVDHGKESFINTKGFIDVVKSSSMKWWTGAINDGIKYILENLSPEKDDIILVINDDVLIKNDYLEGVIKSINDNSNSVIGSICLDEKTNKTVYVNMLLNKIKANFIYINKGVSLSDIKEEYIESDVLKGRGTVFPVSIIQNIGLYNEERLPHYKADHELPWRAKRFGYRVIVSRNMVVYSLLNSPNTYNKKLSILKNFKNIFFEMRSTYRIKDLWNYSHISFRTMYALYYFVVNFIKSMLIFIKIVIKNKMRFANENT